MATVIPQPESLDFYLWGHMKSVVYETSVTSEVDLVARIVEEVVRVRDTPAYFQRVRESMYRRSDACIAANGRNF